MRTWVGSAKIELQVRSKNQWPNGKIVAARQEPKIPRSGSSSFPLGKAEAHNNLWGVNSDSAANTVHQVLFTEYCSKPLFTMYRLYCSSDTVAINLSHPFLIKWLREGEGRGTIPLCLSPPKGRGYAPKIPTAEQKIGRQNQSRMWESG
jgi:hypothetical protein